MTSFFERYRASIRHQTERSQQTIRRENIVLLERSAKYRLITSAKKVNVNQKYLFEANRSSTQRYFSRFKENDFLKQCFLVKERRDIKDVKHWDHESSFSSSQAKVVWIETLTHGPNITNTSLWVARNYAEFSYGIKEITTFNRPEFHLLQSSLEI